MNCTPEVIDGSVLGKLPNLKEIELSGSNIDNLETISKSQSLKTFTGSFKQFYVLKDLFDRKIDFSKLTGETTETQSKIWSNYISN